MFCSCENNVQNNIQSRSPSSEEDNSPTEMNNCRRLIDKPPLVCITFFYIYILHRLRKCTRIRAIN